MKKPYVILGAGPCGLYAGRVLSRAGLPVVILERESHIGGLAASFHKGENWYDLGVHMLHAFDKEIFEDIKTLMGDERIEVELDARIRWAGKSYRYPLQFQDMIKGIPPWRLAYQVFGLLYAQMTGHFRKRKAVNAEEALKQIYGRPLYHFFFEEFTYRYWGMHPRELSATFVTTKMPRLSAVDIFKRFLGKLGVRDHTRAVDSALLKETLHYSRTGSEAMPRSIVRAIQSAGGRVVLGASIHEIHTEMGQVTLVRYEKEGMLVDLPCQGIISTIAIPALVRMFQHKVPHFVVESASQLQYKPISVYGLLIKKPKCLDALYVYYRDRIFHRLAEPKNAGMVVNPEDHTVLIVEMTCEQGDAKWQGHASVLKQITADLEAEKICNGSDIVEVHLNRTELGYPIFKLGFEAHLKSIQDYLQQFSNLISTGRQGAFSYPNMHKAMRMGSDAAEKLKSHARLDEVPEFSSNIEIKETV